MGAVIAFAALNVLILLFAVGAVVHGRSAMRRSKEAGRAAAFLAAFVHMAAGGLILACYALAAVIFLLLL